MNDQHDHDFGDDKLSAIYQQSCVEEPPMKLDSAILAEGRKAVAKKGKWWRASWITPMATVSVAVLAVAIGMLNKSMVNEHEVIMEKKAQDAMIMEDSAEPVREMKSLGNIESMRQSAPAPKAAPEASGMAAPAPAPAPAQLMEQEAVAPAIAPAPAMKRKAAPAEKMELRSREGMVAEPQQFIEEMDLAKPQAKDEVLKPEAWLEKIRELKAAGKDEEVARELELFRKAYPDYEIPKAYLPIN